MKKINHKDSSNTIPNYISVYHMDYSGHSLMVYNDLFDGFDNLYVITFSYGLDFIKEISDKFDYVEIILGCHALIKEDLQLIMAHQERSIIDVRKFISNNNSLIEKIKNNKLKFFVTNGLISHEKIFILTKENGENRIIIGSANFSRRSFDGTQGEFIACIDNSCDALEDFMSAFNSLKELSTTEIAKKSILTDTSINIDKIKPQDIPIINEVKINKKVITVESSNNYSEIEYFTDLKNISRKYDSIIPKYTTEQPGKILIKPITVTRLINNYLKVEEIKNTVERTFPEFLINYNDSSVSMDGVLWDLNPSEENVINDINLFVKYLDGFNDFVGNTKSLKYKYFTVANYMFLSPFIACLRYESYIHNYPERLFPIYGILCGDSNSGKSSFIKMILKMMFNKSMPIYYSEDYKKTSVSAVISEVKGCPVLFDDIRKKRFDDHSDEIIKYSDRLPELGFKEHPVIILTSNDIYSLKKEYQKRCIAFFFNQKIDNITAITSTKAVFDIIDNITNSFYREYLKRMIPEVRNMIEKIRNESYLENEYPDIFNISSKIILDIFDDYGIVKPECLKELTFDNDYFGDIIKSERAIQIIKNAWENNKGLFKIDNKRNKLIYFTDMPYEAKWIVNELPVSLDAKSAGCQVIMKLNEAEKFFKIKFKKRFFNK